MDELEKRAARQRAQDRARLAEQPPAVPVRMCPRCGVEPVKSYGSTCEECFVNSMPRRHGGERRG